MPLPLGSFADVEDYEVIPAGQYHATVFKGDLKTAGSEAKHPGSEYISWEFNIQEPGYEKRKQWMNTSLVPEARSLLKRFLKGVGYTDEEMNQPDFSIEIEDVCGREVMLQVSVSESEQYGKQNKVKRVFPVSEAVDSELP
jgi:hypothetical protein